MKISKMIIVLAMTSVTSGAFAGPGQVGSADGGLQAKVVGKINQSLSDGKSLIETYGNLEVEATLKGLTPEAGEACAVNIWGTQGGLKFQTVLTSRPNSYEYCHSEGMVYIEEKHDSRIDNSAIAKCLKRVGLNEASTPFLRVATGYDEIKEGVFQSNYSEDYSSIGRSTVSADERHLIFETNYGNSWLSIQMALKTGVYQLDSLLPKGKLTCLIKR